MNSQKMHPQFETAQPTHKAHISEKPLNLQYSMSCTRTDSPLSMPIDLSTKSQRSEIREQTCSLFPSSISNSIGLQDLSSRHDISTKPLEKCTKNIYLSPPISNIESMKTLKISSLPQAQDMCCAAASACKNSVKQFQARIPDHTFLPTTITRQHHSYLPPTTLSIDSMKLLQAPSLYNSSTISLRKEDHSHMNINIPLTISCTESPIQAPELLSHPRMHSSPILNRKFNGLLQTSCREAVDSPNQLVTHGHFGVSVKPSQLPYNTLLPTVSTTSPTQIMRPWEFRAISPTEGDSQDGEMISPDSSRSSDLYTPRSTGVRSPDLYTPRSTGVRPFKAIPLNPLYPTIEPVTLINSETPKTLSFIKNSEKEYQEFRKRSLARYNLTVSSNSNMRRTQNNPEKCKDPEYLERRRKNNEAAKRSRDARKTKALEIAIRHTFLEHEQLAIHCKLDEEEKEVKDAKHLFEVCASACEGINVL